MVLMIAVFASAGTLHAQASKIFVASTGNDANDGSRAAPKRSFQAAHDAVGAGGDIVVLDTAGYGAVNITKSVAISVPPGVNGFVTVSGLANAITVNATGTDVISIRGLVLEGGGSTASDGDGILAYNCGQLVVEDCVFRSFGAAILFMTTSNAQLVVRNTSISNVRDGITLEPSGNSVTQIGVITGCLVTNANQGAIGVTMTVGSIAAKVTVSNSVLVNSATGVYPYGTGAGVWLDNCVISGNTNGVFSASGAVVYSRGNNTFTANGTDGTMTAFVAK